MSLLNHVSPSYMWTDVSGFWIDQHVESLFSMLCKDDERWISIFFFLNSFPDDPLLIRCTPVFYISKVQPVAPMFECGSPSQLRLNILSNLINPILIDSISVSIIFWAPQVSSPSDHMLQRQLSHSSHSSQILSRRSSNQSERMRQYSGASQSHHSRQPSGSSIFGIDLYNRIQETIQVSSQSIDLHESIELKQDKKTVTSSGIICRSPLQRLNSIPSMAKEKEVKRNDWNLSLTLHDCLLNPGNNEIVVSTLVSHF